MKLLKAHFHHNSIDNWSKVWHKLIAINWWRLNKCYRFIEGFSIFTASTKPFGVRTFCALYRLYSIVCAFAAVRDKISWFHNVNTCGFSAKTILVFAFFWFRSVWLTLKEHIMSIYSGYTFHYSIYEYGFAWAQWHTFSRFSLVKWMQQLFCVFSHPTNLSSHRKTHIPHDFMNVCTPCAHIHTKYGHIFYHST